MPPRMIVVAGPPGSGKSSIFPVSSFGVAGFNADDRAAELNGGSYVRIPQQIRAVVNREAFVLGCIERRTSFAIETTLRSAVTFDQAALAKAAGFITEMRYLALRDCAMHVERVKVRADAGGHSASETTLLKATRRVSPIFQEPSPRWMTSGSTTIRRLEDHPSWFWKVKKANGGQGRNRTALHGFPVAGERP